MTAFAADRSAVLSEIADTLARVDPADIADAAELLAAASDKRVFVIGVGREGLAARGFAMRLMHCGLTVHWVWDETTPGIMPGDVLVMVNGPGTIGHLGYVYEQAIQAGARTLVVTGAPSAPLPRSADVCLTVPGAVYRGTDPTVGSIQPMGSLFEQCAAITFDLLILELMRHASLTSADLAARHRNIE